MKRKVIYRIVKLITGIGTGDHGQNSKLLFFLSMKLTSSLAKGYDSGPPSLHIWRI
jgi:hypothetical protein